MHIVPADKGALKGKVTSVIFKGIHYQILVQCGRYEIEIQSTAAPAVGEEIGLTVSPDGIHVMKKNFRVNQYTGVITKKNTVKFGDGEFACDVTQLYPEVTWTTRGTSSPPREKNSTSRTWRSTSRWGCKTLP